MKYVTKVTVKSWTWIKGHTAKDSINVLMC